MTITDIQNLQTVNVEGNDFSQIFRKNEFDLTLSYKYGVNALKKLFVNADTVNDLKQKIENLSANFQILVEKFATKEEVDKSYIKKETLEARKPSFLTNSGMENLLSKYTTEDKMTEKEKNVRKEANRLADEMTDFIGAAMVGINQSAGGVVATPAEGEGEGEEG